MIRNLNIARAVKAHYIGQPTFTLHVDGASTGVSISPPTNGDIYKTRVLTIPEATVGNTFHITSSQTTETNFEVVKEPLSNYEEELLWHYYKITYTGDVNVSLYVDDVLKVGDGDDASTATAKKALTTTLSQNTKKVYLPAMSYGRVPHVRSDSADTGHIVKWSPVALPLAFYKRFEGVAEGQITYNGVVFVDFYIDGEKIGDTYQFDQKFNATGAATYATKTFLFPENSGGRIFQYVQVAGDGDIVTLETDAHQLDPSPAVVTEPEG